MKAFKIFFFSFLILIFESCTEKSDTISELDTVGHIEKALSKVELRRAQKLVWKEAPTGIPLQDYDAIKTSSKSSATIRFRDGKNLDISERSLVIILEHKSSKERNLSIVALPRGKVSGRLPATTDIPREFEIRTKRGWIKVSNAKQAKKIKEVAFEVNVTQQGMLKVRSEQGEISVATKKVEKLVREGESVVIKPQPLEKPAEEEEGDEKLTKNSFKTLPEVSEKEWESSLPAPTPLPTPSPTSKPKVKAKVNLRSLPEALLKPLVIDYPKNSQTVSDEVISVRGKIKDGYIIYLNGQKIEKLGSGAFAHSLRLKYGLNLLTFQIVNQKTKKVSHQTTQVIFEEKE